MLERSSAAILGGPVILSMVSVMHRMIVSMARSLVVTHRPRTLGS